MGSDQYLVYEGGGTTVVYDENGHRPKELPVIAKNYTMPGGLAPVSVTTHQAAPTPWLEAQFIKEREAMVVKARR